MMREFEIIVWSIMARPEVLKEQGIAKDQLFDHLLHIAYYVKISIEDGGCEPITAYFEQTYANFFINNSKWLLIHEPDLSLVTP